MGFSHLRVDCLNVCKKTKEKIHFLRSWGAGEISESFAPKGCADRGSYTPCLSPGQLWEPSRSAVGAEAGDTDRAGSVPLQGSACPALVRAASRAPVSGPSSPVPPRTCLNGVAAEGCALVLYQRLLWETATWGKFPSSAKLQMKALPVMLLTVSFNILHNNLTFNAMWIYSTCVCMCACVGIHTHTHIQSGFYGVIYMKPT